MASSLEKVEVLNKKVSVCVHKRTLQGKGLSPHPGICDIDVSVEGVYNLLLNINSYKACGPDQIHGRVLKETADVTAPILRTLFQSLESFLMTGDLQTLLRSSSRGINSNLLIIGQSH